MKEHIFLAIPLLLLTLHTQGQKQQTRTAESLSCTDSPLLAELGKASGATILSSYGYHFNEAWACTKIESPWAAGASLLHFRKISAQSDDATAFSVIEVAGVTQIWVIPTESGMLEVQNVESDPHNLAAFNALLRSLPKPPSGPVEWKAVGKLYMALLGHTGAVLIEPPPGQPGSCNSEGECTVAFSDRIPHAKEPYTKWTLTFSVANGSNPARLTDAVREVVSSAESQTEPIGQPNGVLLSHESGHVDPPKQQ
ncbi:MAG: hypothetical protein ABR928_05510 [Terracidiphilus sp.]|jgi:hypothetical protein